MCLEMNFSKLSESWGKNLLDEAVASPLLTHVAPVRYFFFKPQFPGLKPSQPNSINGHDESEDISLGIMSCP